MQGPVFLVGKLATRQVDAFSLPAGSSSSSLLYLHDSLSNRRFLVDSGASISVFPAPPSTTVSGVKLLTADGSTVSCSGSRIIPLKFGSSSFQWLFQLAPVAVPILGADFLLHHQLLVDVAGRRVFKESPSSSCVLDACESSSSPPRACLIAAPKCVSELLAEFPDVLSSDGFEVSSPRHDVRHHILTNPGPPVFAKARRLDPVKLAAAKRSS